MSVRAEIRAKLTGPGGPFEIVEEEVHGERMQVLKKRIPSLRAMLEASEAHGEREYLVHGGQRFSYARHRALVASLARVLAERYGIGKGDRVAILAANRAEWVLTFWATISLGGIVAALNGWWTEDEIAYGLSDCGPKLLVGDRKRLARLGSLDPGIPLLEMESDLPPLLDSASSEALPRVPIAEDDPAVILYTSGTTGRPKGALASHRGVVGFVQTAILAGLESTLVDSALGAAGAPSAAAGPPCCLVTAPLFHLSGLYAMVVMQLVLGGKIVLRSGRFDPEDVLRHIERERVTTWAALGSMGPRVAAVPDLERFDRSSLVNLGFGGAPASPALQERMREVFPNARTSLGIGYGSSETVATVAMLRGTEYALHPESTGYAVATHQIEIRDPQGRALREGEEGEIHVRSPYLMLGYWGNPEATRQTLGPGRWLATGDIGRVEEGLLYINSRARDMILRSAENVYPVEIENRLEAHPGVREAAVVGVDHETLGQEVKAIVVSEEAAGLERAELRRWCAETLAPYKVPSLWEIREEPLPRNAAGKVLKNVLRGETEYTFVEE